MPESVGDIWQYLKDHDAPNWIVIIISLFVWPPILGIIVYWWTNRKRQSAPHFLVTFTPSKIHIDQTPHDAVVLTFINQTGSIVYLSRARLTEVQKRFPIPVAASRDMARGWRELLSLDKLSYIKREARLASRRQRREFCDAERA